MGDELLPYYNRELAYIRTSGGEFAKKYPKIAGRLRLTQSGSQDPHVERVLEGFAYLCARIRHKLDDDFPEITDAMLGVLYPHYQAPIPSMGVVQFHLDRTQAELTAGYQVPRGTPLETEPVDGEHCHYKTCYDTTLWPFHVETAGLYGRPYEAPATRSSAQAPAVVHLRLATFSEAVAFGRFGCTSLRFFLRAGEAQNVYQLYELLFNNTLEIALAGSPRDNKPLVLPKTALQAVGFARNEAVLPFSQRSFAGYRLLSEFFSFPEKFLFVELTGIDPRYLQHVGNRLEIYFYLNRTSPDLERQVTNDTFRLGCTPMVNLFHMRADPFVLSQTQTEYRIIPDARRPAAVEIYSIDKVFATSPGGDQVEFAPFYSFKHAVDHAEQNTFWYASRRPNLADVDERGEADASTEMYLSLVDLNFTPTIPAEWTIDLEITAINRDLPRRLPFGGGRPELELPGGKGPISQALCVTHPTPTHRPPLKARALWRIISHLTLNHLSLTDDEEGTDALREILKLYDTRDTPETRAMLEGIAGVKSRRVVGRISGQHGGFCRGIEIGLLLDEEKFLGSGAFLFASALDRFLGLYTSINSFSKLVVTTRQREAQGEIWRWPLRTGEQVLL
ncbi:MAG: type VI secretion system baseplate subunit TssF [Pirellulales bacterium]